jgi:hypothetical protein
MSKESYTTTWLRDLWIGASTGICGSPLLWENQHRLQVFWAFNQAQTRKSSHSK